MSELLAQRTIADFGEQWLAYRDNTGFYGSLDLFRDMTGGLLPPESLKGQRVLDIGSGTGRIVAMLLAAGAGHVTAVEPSEGFAALEENMRPEQQAGRVTLQRLRGEAIPASADHDLATSIGVLHHIPDPAPVVRAAFGALRPGGRFFVWLYGREGNALYLALLATLAPVTRRLPHKALAAVARLLDVPIVVYIALCRRLPLPLRRYMVEVMGRLDAHKRRLNIYDQLNPAYAKYYTQSEARRLLEEAGFVDVRLHHRHGYSWSVVGTKPAAR